MRNNKAVYQVGMACLAVCCLLSLASCGSQKTLVTAPTQAPTTAISSTQRTTEVFSPYSIGQYLTYIVPKGLLDGGYNPELGYLGGNLFSMQDSGSPVAQEASDGTPAGWNSFGGVEVYYRLKSHFSHGQLVDVALPWNHAAYLTEPEPVDNCKAPAVLVQVSFDLYTAAEAYEKQIDIAKRSATQWYVFMTREGSEICYAVFLNAGFYSREDVLSLARSVQFSDQAFNLVIR